MTDWALRDQFSAQFEYVPSLAGIFLIKTQVRISFQSQERGEISYKQPRTNKFPGPFKRPVLDPNLNQPCPQSNFKIIALAPHDFAENFYLI